MSRALALVGTAVVLAGLAAVAGPVGLLVVAGLELACLAALWTQRGSAAAVLMGIVALASVVAHGISLVASAGFLLQALGLANAPGPRAVPWASWAIGAGLAAAAVVVAFWIPLRDSILASGSPLPLVLLLAAGGMAAAMWLLRDDAPDTPAP